MAGEKILVVEDEEITVEDLVDTLELLGYDVVAAVPSGEEAVEKAGELLPDLVLMDIELEGEIDGIMSAKQIKEERDIPIVFLTAYSDEKTIEKLKLVEPEGYILKEPFNLIYKPFKEDELRSVLELTLHKYK
ncbi:MAG: response regulator [Methanobacteriaceae archaeon]|jgi:CheY-like chemotaxis protein|nr:response regulator [Methanobacteriaceae archaeon]